MTKAVFLIGGLGTRLRPLTLHTPKPLLPLVNRPFLQYPFAAMKKHGVEEIILCTAYQPAAFKKQFGSGRQLGVTMRYVHEKKPLGTGGAIKNAERFVDGSTLIANGDILIDLDYAALFAFHREKNAAVTIALVRVPDPSAYGLVETDASGRIRSFIEKPKPEQQICNTINAGVYIFEPSVWKEIPGKKVVSVERDVFPLLLKKGFPMYGYLSNRYWMDIGTLEKYRQAQLDLLTRLCGSPFDETLAPAPAKGVLHGPVVIGKGAKVAKDVTLEGPCVIGAKCRIESGATIKQSILLDDVVVGPHSMIEQSVIGHRSRIGAYVQIGAHRALGSGSVIPDYSRL